jgi:peptidoglycan/LPS O-acetylase OafA/YrhL
MALLLAGGLLLLVLELTGLENWSQSSPWPTFYRMGQAMLALGFLSALPVFAFRGWSALGRSSLGVYVSHLVLLYGWAGDEGWSRNGPTSCRARRRSRSPPPCWQQRWRWHTASFGARWLEEKAAPRWEQPSGEPG